MLSRYIDCRSLSVVAEFTIMCSHVLSSFTQQRYFVMEGMESGLPDTKNIHESVYTDNSAAYKYLNWFRT